MPIEHFHVRVRKPAWPVPTRLPVFPPLDHTCPGQPARSEARFTPLRCCKLARLDSLCCPCPVHPIPIPNPNPNRFLLTSHQNQNSCSLNAWKFKFTFILHFSFIYRYITVHVETRHLTHHADCLLHRKDLNFPALITLIDAFFSFFSYLNHVHVHIWCACNSTLTTTDFTCACPESIEEFYV